MPMINLKITKGESTPQQKAQVMQEMTEVLQRVMGKNPDTTIVIIEEVDTDNWGIGGKSVTQRRAED
jgi:4-oxalocrotonate tautomerase